MNKLRFLTVNLLLFIVLGLYADSFDKTSYYSAANGKKGAALKTAMAGIIYRQTAAVSYSGLKAAYTQTDVRGNNILYDIYSQITNYTAGSAFASSYSKEGDGYNREHLIPQSLFSKNPPMVSDLHHVYPSDAKMNGVRSDYCHGNVGTIINTDGTPAASGNFCYLGTPASTLTSNGCTEDKVFEPNDMYKGDIARAYFYFVTCYETMITSWGSKWSDYGMFDGSTYPAFSTWAKIMLLDWAELDQVSSKETTRNEAVYNYPEPASNNRNPFVDFPGLEQYIWGSYSNVAFNASNYVNPYEGGSIIITPDISLNMASTSIVEGNVASLSATVSNANGATVTWTTSDSNVASLNNTTGNYVSVYGESAGTATITASITVDGNTYSATCIVVVTPSGSGLGSGDYYAKVTNAPSDWSGTYLIVCESKNVALDGGLTTLDVVSNTISVTPSNNQIAITSATEAAEFTIASKSGGYSLQSKSGYYIGHSGSSNGLRSSTSDDFTNTISLSGGDVTITCNGKKLRYNSSSGQTRFRYFGSEQTAIQLYKKVAVPVIEPETPTVSFATLTKEMTVGETYTQTVTTNSDGEVTYSISPADVANIDSSTGEVTAVGAGTATVTANVAATSSFTAGSAQYTLTVIRKTPTISFATLSVELTEGDTYTQTATYDGDGDISYTSSNTDVVTVNSSTGEVTAVGVGTATITATSTQTTTYSSATATYQVTVESSGSGSGGDDYYYAKVTSAPSDWSGEYLIVYERSSINGVILNGGNVANSANGTDVTISSGSIAASSDVTANQFTITAKSGGYSIQGADGKYIGGTSGSNVLNFGTSDSYTNTITYDTSTSSVLITCNTSVLRYNTVNNLFRYYKSTSYGNQAAIQLYKKESGTMPTGLVAPSVYFATSSVDLAEGDTYTQTVTTNSDGAVTYSVSPTNVATINSSTGQVTAVGIGTAIVTATVAATSYYNASQAQYIVNVRASSVQTTGSGTLDDPYTVADVLQLYAGNTVPGQAVYVRGIVSRITSLNPPTFGNARYYISDDGSTDNEFYVYNGKYINRTDFTSTDQLKVGDEVVICGSLTTYYSGSTPTNEFAAGNYIVILNGSFVAVDSTASFDDPSVNIFAGDTYKQRVSTNSNGAISYGSSDTSVATVNPSTGLVTAVAEGTCTITATVAPTSWYNGCSASYTVTVEAAPTAPYYVLVNSNDELEEGRQYLIVSDAYNKAMDGSLANLDAPGNSIDVSISDNRIPVTPTTTAAEFTVTRVETEHNTCYSLKGKSGYYIGFGISEDYEVFLTSTTDAYPNTVFITEWGLADIYCNYTTQNGRTIYYICCGPNDQRIRFFYYTQNTRTVQLYKRVDVTVPGDINQDGAVDASDVNVLVRILLGNDSEEYNHDAADVNKDSTVSIADLTALVNLLNEVHE